MAEGMGCKGFRFDRADQVETVLAEFLAYRDGPAVLDAVCGTDEHVYPMVPAGRALSEMVLDSTGRGAE